MAHPSPCRREVLPAAPLSSADRRHCRLGAARAYCSLAETREKHTRCRACCGAAACGCSSSSLPGRSRSRRRSAVPLGRAPEAQLAVPEPRGADARDASSFEVTLLVWPRVPPLSRPAAAAPGCGARQRQGSRCRFRRPLYASCVAPDDEGESGAEGARRGRPIPRFVWMRLGRWAERSGASHVGRRRAWSGASAARAKRHRRAAGAGEVLADGSGRAARHGRSACAALSGCSGGSRGACLRSVTARRSTNSRLAASITRWRLACGDRRAASSAVSHTSAVGVGVSASVLAAWLERGRRAIIARAARSLKRSALGPRRPPLSGAHARCGARIRRHSRSAHERPGCPRSNADHRRAHGAPGIG